MEQPTIKVYARANEQGQVTKLLNTIFDTADITGTDTYMGEGYGDAYAYPHTRFTLFQADHTHNYKLVDGKLTETTDEDKAAEIALRPPPPPSMEQRLQATESAMLDLLLQGGI